ncbi:MAG: hypothetical protein FJ286_17580 [Planctomycetes bacterium]|nr:hypothetical protein [Planctomycetota bacterium]
MSKAQCLVGGDVELRSASVFADTPGCCLTGAENANTTLLADVATVLHGQNAGDNSIFNRQFWEVDHLGDMWRAYQGPSETTCHFGGRTKIVRWENECGLMARRAAEVRHLNNKAQQWRSGKPHWGKRGIVVSLVGRNYGTLYSGDIYSDSCGVIVPKEQAFLGDLWEFVRCGEFERRLRQIDPSLAVSIKTLLTVNYDPEEWRAAFLREYPSGLPNPHSSDPTQWLFNGHPKDSDNPLHVAVARLVGYQWPRQTGSEFPDCPALGPDGLESHADTDGIVCLSSVRGEPTAADRLLALLADAYGPDWSADLRDKLLADVEAAGETLDDWLRDSFFAQHLKLFHQRPFVWHIWDGLRDGFHVLVNYHRLAGPAGEGRRTLEKIAYEYLGDWITRQKAQQAAGAEGADARVAAAVHLQEQLAKIIEGEPPYDIFVRWKPLTEQPIGWDPDINDGVRLNIRPFMTARPLGAKAKKACILRVAPGIEWKKDRGTEPDRPKAQFPWFWTWDGTTQDFAGGTKFDGSRHNDLHYTRKAKEAARQ